MAELLTRFEMKHHRQVVLRTVLSSLGLATLTGIMIKYVWEGLFAASIYPTVFQVQIVAFLLTLFIASPVLYGMFLMSLSVSRKNHELFQLANLDPLTGIYNRRALSDTFAMLARKARRNGEPGVLLVIDVDKFKAINDRHGHEIGDHVLIHLADNLRSFKTDQLCFARLGGEEFAVARFGAKDLDAYEFAEKIRKQIEGKSLQLGELTIAYTVSIGYCPIDQNDTLNVALRNADAALYTAKRTGRNRTVCFDAGMPSLVPQTGDMIQLEEKRPFSHASSSN